MKYLYTLILMIKFFNLSIAQVSNNGTPKSLQHNIRNNLPYYIMEEIDVDALFLEDELENKNIPFRFGFPLEVDIGLNQHTWSNLETNQFYEFQILG